MLTNQFKLTIGTEKLTFESLRKKRPYYQINREERNLAAILYHFLLLPGNLEKCLDSLKIDFDRGELPKAEIYYEYAYLRDLWNNLGTGEEANNKKYNLITSNLPSINGIPERSKIFEINTFFGAVNTSKTDIQIPSRWSNNYLQEKFAKYPEVKDFKHCFNAKPDLVIHLSPTKAVCIETKLESGEGRKKDYSQFETQKKIMELLGFTEVKHILIQKEDADTQKMLNNKDMIIINWRKIFFKEENKISPRFETTSQPNFINDWLANNTTIWE